MNDERKKSPTRLIWLVVILQVMTIGFLLSTRFIDAEAWQRWHRSIARYEEQAERYERERGEYAKAMAKYKKQSEQYEKDRAEYKKLIEDWHDYCTSRIPKERLYDEFIKIIDKRFGVE